MSQESPDNVMEREDLGDVTVLRVLVPMLSADDVTESIFQQAYAVVDQAGRTKLVLNLEGVVFVASLGWGKLVRLLHKTRQAGGKLILCKVSRNLEEMLRITRLADILLTYADEQQAVRSFTGAAR
jgi:anti-sigma B factor antagonist